MHVCPRAAFSVLLAAFEEHITWGGSGGGRGSRVRASTQRGAGKARMLETQVTWRSTPINREMVKEHMIISTTVFINEQINI